MLAPSATAKQPFATNACASVPFSSFCVAHGKATSHFTPHGVLPPTYSQPKTLAYSSILPRLTFFSSMIHASFFASMPSLSYTYPLESDMVITVPPIWITFSAAYCDTFPEPEITHRIPFSDLPLVFNISSRKYTQP